MPGHVQQSIYSKQLFRDSTSTDADWRELDGDESWRHLVSVCGVDAAL